tara:strand:- start:796 stop:1239 length:444 start_codon:yes stop_codon:yes gene_type:complete
MSTIVVGTVKNNSTGAPTVQDSSGVEIGQFAGGWTSFSGGHDDAFGDRASFNVSSLTDHGTGDYSVNWQNDFPSANGYAVVASCCADGSVNGSHNVVCIHTNGTVQTAYGSGTLTDPTAGVTRLVVVHTPNRGTQDVDYISVVAFGV